MSNTSPYGPSQSDFRGLSKSKRVWAAGIGLLLLGAAMGSCAADEGPKANASARPTVTATVTETAEPEPAVTVTETAEPEPAVTVTETVEVEVESGSDDDFSYDDSDSGSDSGSVYYENCAAARAAGAAPVHRGDPGYAAHLDRDGDGTGCE